jgi:hypothetical protein
MVSGDAPTAAMANVQGRGGEGVRRQRRGEALKVVVVASVSDVVDVAGCPTKVGEDVAGGERWRKGDDQHQGSSGEVRGRHSCSC